MAGSLNDYAEKACLDWLLNAATVTRPSALYLGLFTTAEGETGAGATEVASFGYARQAITFGAAALGTGVSLNSNTPSFTAAGGNWGTVTNFCVFDAATGGNPIFYGTLTTSRTVNDGDTLTFGVGNLSLTLD